MEQSRYNSCLMLAADLVTPVSLGSIFRETDLKDKSSIVYNSHVTVIFAKKNYIDKGEVLEVIENLDPKFLEWLKNQDNVYKPVGEIFSLDKFENDTDHVILRLKEGTEAFEKLWGLNEKLMNHFSLTSEFGEYKPYLTLANVKSGKADDYLLDKRLTRMLDDSLVRFEDLIISYGIDDIDGYKDHDITHWNSVERFFRIRDLKRELE